MSSYPRFTPAERRKLTMSTRARESFRTVGIRGGAGPGEGAPSTIAPYYTLSEDDRATFENTMNMVHDNDILKQRTAKSAMDQALKNRPIIRAAVDSLYNTSVGIPIGTPAFEGAWTTLCFAGYCTETQWEIPDEPGFCSDGDFQAIGIKSVDIQGGDYNVSGGQARQYKRGAGLETKTSLGDTIAYGVHFDSSDGCHPVICLNGTVIAEKVGCVGNTGQSLNCLDAYPRTLASASGAEFEVSSCQDDTVFDLLYDNWGAVHSGADDECATGSNWTLSGTVPGVGESGGLTVGFRDADGTLRCDVLGNGIYDYAPDLADMNPIGGAVSDFPITDVPLNDLCDIIDDLKNNPDLAQYLPPPGTPPGTPPPIDTPPVTPPPPVDSPPTQPPDPGTNPFPGQPPTDPGTPPGDPSLPPGDPGLPPTPTVPPGPVPPTAPGTEPIDTGIQDPGAGGCMALASKPSGFHDPSQPGGIARQFQPGQPMVIDYGENSKCQAKIVKVTPNVGADGGPEICVGGGIDNSGRTTEKTCYGPGLVTDAIQSVLGSMVAEGGSIIFDSDSTRQLYRPLCFRAGTSKRVILNKLLDMVGFCVFPMFDCNVIVGYCGPVNVVWTYHEDVDLIKFDLEYDGQEIFDYVEVFRGDFISRAGNVFVPGNSVLYPVGSPASSISGDRVYQYEVPYGTPDSELNSIAVTLAAKLRSQALPEIAFGVPLNSQLALRHQLRIQMPSVGFDAYYMVTRLARDYNRENGHLSTGLARWLHAT